MADLARGQPIQPEPSVELAEEPGQRVLGAEGLGVLEGEGDGLGARRRAAAGHQEQQRAEEREASGQVPGPPGARAISSSTLWRCAVQSWAHSIIASSRRTISQSA